MKNQLLQIRNATAADNQLLASLGAETFRDAFEADNNPEDLAAYLKIGFNPETLAAELVEPGSLFMIAEIEGTPVGYARLREGALPQGIPNDDPIEIHRIYTVMDQVGQGIGAGLMAACLEEARLRGRNLIWLGVWEKNPRAIAFYRKWGFQVVGSQPFLMGQDPQTDLLMARPVKMA